MLRRWVALKTVRPFSTTTIRRFNPLDPTELLSTDDQEDGTKKEAEEKKKDSSPLKEIGLKSFEAGAVTFVSLLVLALGGVAYHKLYRESSTRKVLSSFEAGYDLTHIQKHRLTTDSNQDDSDQYWVHRDEQKVLDGIAQGDIKGRYLLIIGEKGTGKTTALMKAIQKVHGKDCAIVECSSDPELMRLRIGEALNFKFNEDYIGSLFSMRGPRETTALLDIERAFTMVERVALRRSRKTSKPLVLIFNNVQLIRNDEDGRKLVELLQQKAELFASSGLMTMVFSSDDYWLYEKFKGLATRLEVLNFRDLTRLQARGVLKMSRKKYFNERLSDSQCDEIYKLVGGRPQHLNHVASHEDMFEEARNLVQKEKTWVLNQCGLLGTEMDDDVIESGKVSTSAMLLIQELVRLDDEKREEMARKEAAKNERKHSFWGMRKEDGNLEKLEVPEESDYRLPELPLWRARQIMTRPDYIEKYDHMNIFTIDSLANVRADSVPMMTAFREIVHESGFAELLGKTVDRVSAIESLGRTRELVLKHNLEGKYKENRFSVNGNNY